MKRKRKRAFRRWKNSIYGEWFKYVFGENKKIDDSNIVFFDIEFFPKIRGKPPRLKMAVWHETKPSSGHRKHGIAWYDGRDDIEHLVQALIRSDYIVAYNPRSLDYPSLEPYGITEQRVLLKTIDLYEAVFKELSVSGHGSLEAVTKLNKGPGKYRRKNNSREEYQKQCQRDVKMLEYMFWKLRGGDFLSSRFGRIILEDIWHDIQEEEYPSITEMDRLIQQELEMVIQQNIENFNDQGLIELPEQYFQEGSF